MMCRSIDPDYLGTSNVCTLGGTQSMIVIWEPGIYEALSVSRKEKAKPFKKWLFEDVLPSIRKTGSYHLDKERAEIKQLSATLEEEKKELRFMSASLSRQQSELDDRSEFLLLAQKRYMENPDRIRKVVDSPLTIEEKKREIELRKQFPNELLLWETETKIKIMVLANKFGKISIPQLMEYDLGLSPEQYPPLLRELAEDHGAKVEGEGLNMVYTSQRVLMEAISVAMKAYR
jgi:prophage antirepressor-like protein